MSIDISPEQLEYRAIDIVERMPSGSYTDYYQPKYPDYNQLVDAVRELTCTTPVTTPENILVLRNQLALVASGEIGPLIMAGNCAEPIKAEQHIEDLVTANQVILDTMRKAIPDGIHVVRSRGQFGKPRSNEFEVLESGEEVVSHMGDGINSIDPGNRQPDPTRLVAGAVQSRDVEELLTELNGHHIPAAHEALIWAYEQAFIRKIANKMYLLSADLPWIGLRTNNPDGAHVKMLSGIQNSVGGKLGPDTTPETIRELADRLNPGRLPGKLVLMLRFGLDNLEAMESSVDAIAEHCPESVIIVDQHGSTTTNSRGQKIRSTEVFIEEVIKTAEKLNSVGLLLNGVHVEAIADNSRRECVETPDQIPSHPGNVDPQLNPSQLSDVLVAVNDVLQ